MDPDWGITDADDNLFSSYDNYDNAYNRVLIALQYSCHFDIFILFINSADKWNDNP